ncbi:UNVERIFIED_CONTAM: hypothetical protein Sradi_6230600 [Sesamum radiatum]|uniref:Uncharacterized protein n=1 Tax=Sesamum radiatum TaxID=300843 RepID=A0AAW2KD02_SESRA
MREFGRTRPCVPSPKLQNSSPGARTTELKCTPRADPPPREVKSQLEGLELNQVLQQHLSSRQQQQIQLEAHCLELNQQHPRKASSRQSCLTAHLCWQHLHAVKSPSSSLELDVVEALQPRSWVEAGGQPRLSPSSRHLMWSGSRSAMLARCSDPKLEDEAPNVASAGI